jgi:hypothetical protein
MSGRIFVHIGLPKTATTTLQTEIFPALCSDKVLYLGVFQPRQDSNQHHEYRMLYEAVSTGLSLEEARSVLGNMLDAGTTIILSEEMFTVSTEISWREKLRNLAALLHGFDHGLILTVREPAAAIFSYYVELNELFFREKKSFLELARVDERMHIFHYRKLVDEILQHFDRENVFVKKFEDVVAGRLDDLCRLIDPERLGWHGLQPKKHNEKKHARDVVYTGKKFTVADIARRLSVTLGIIDANFAVKMKKALAPVVRRLDSVALSEKKVFKPSEKEIRQLRNYLKEETAALEKHFGIRYE